MGKYLAIEIFKSKIRLDKEHKGILNMGRGMPRAVMGMGKLIIPPYLMRGILSRRRRINLQWKKPSIRFLTLILFCILWERNKMYGDLLSLKHKVLTILVMLEHLSSPLFSSGTPSRKITRNKGRIVPGWNNLADMCKVPKGKSMETKPIP